MIHQGILSGLEIAAAVERQNHYNMAKALAEKQSPFGWLHRRTVRKLEDQPRIHIDEFCDTPSDLGGRLNPGSYNLRLAPELLVYTEPVLDMRDDNPTQSIIIPEEGYRLEPGRLYLGKTVEWTATYNLIPVIDGRSSLGRLGLGIHVTAGYGDSGYQGHWTLELFAIEPLVIYPNTAIAQIRYHATGKGRPYNGKYQNERGSPPEASKIYREFSKSS